MKTNFKVDDVVRFKADAAAIVHMRTQGIPSRLAGVNLRVSQSAPAGISVIENNGMEWHLSSFRIPETVERGL